MGLRRSPRAAGGGVVAFGVDDVEVVAEPASGHADVAELSVEGVVAEQQRPVTREALGLVGGGRVAVGEVPGVEVRGGDGGHVAGVEPHGEGPLVGVEGGDGAEAAIRQSAAAVVAQGEHPVAGLEDALPCARARVRRVGR